MKSRKGTIEFSMSFLITVIIGVVIIVLGIILISNMVKNSMDTENQVNQELEAQLNSIFSSGKITAVVPSTRTTQPAKTAIYAVGIDNVLNLPGGENNFRISIGFASMTNKNGDTDSPAPPPILAPDDWLVDDSIEVTIKNNENQKKSVAIDVPKGAKLGTYIYNVNIEYDDGTGVYVPYGIVAGSTLKMYLVLN